MLAIKFLVVVAVCVVCIEDDRVLSMDVTMSPQVVALHHTAPTAGYTVLKTYPHRSTAWTEGLSFFHGKLYESTGPTPYNAYSSPTLGGGLAEIDLASGRVTENVNFKDIYGEGATEIGGKWFVLSYEEGKIKEFQAKGLKPAGDFALPNGLQFQGWGATNDGERMIYSDGSSSIRYMDPQTKKATLSF